jgi:hypothetical protein
MSDFLQYIQDVEDGIATVGPDALAPPIKVPRTSSGAIYDERKDPEMNEDSNVLKETRLIDRISRYIRETDNPNYDDYMNSDFSKPRDKEASFEKELKQLERLGGNPPPRRGEGSDSKKSRSFGGPYDAERELDTGVNEEYSQIFQDLHNKYGEASGRDTAEEMFQDLVNVVRNIVLRRSDPKRHALIYGDPGVGKCIAPETKIRIKVEDEVSEKLSQFLKLKRRLK